MEQRINIAKLEPKAYNAFAGIEKYLGETQLDPIHKELIKVRASQINNCAFCIDMHTKDALKYGETVQRLLVLSAWRETDFFSEEEQAILTLTEEMTLISNNGVSAATYAKAAALFDEHYLAQIMVAVIAINMWNRLAVSTHMKPTAN